MTEDLERIGRRLAPEVQSWLREDVGLDHPGTYLLRVYVSKGAKVFKVARLDESEEMVVVDLQGPAHVGG